MNLSLDAFHALGPVLFMVIAGSVVAYVVYELKDFLFLMLGAVGRVKTIEDVLGVVLIGLVAILIVGDYVVFALASILFKNQPNVNLVIYIHLVPYLLMIGIFLMRIVLLSLTPLPARIGNLWASGKRDTSLTIFMTAGALDALHYLLRQFVPSWASWIPIPWAWFWAQCAGIAVLTWSCAAIAFKMSSMRLVD